MPFLGTVIGLINGVLVTILRVPAFIATLTMLLIGRGLVLGLTGGKNIAYPAKAAGLRLVFSRSSETNAFGFNNQIVIFLVVAAAGAIVLAKTRWGYETFATGGNEQAAIYAGIPTRWVRIRAYLMSSLCATLAGLMAIAQDKGVTSQFGLSAELIVIASVIIGGASILGGRGRVIGSCLGAVLTVLINKVLREGWPTTRIIKVDGVDITVNATQPVAGRRRAGLSGPHPRHCRADRALHHQAPGSRPAVGMAARQAAAAAGRDRRHRHRRRPDPGHDGERQGARRRRGFGKFLARRDALAIILVAVLWFTGFYLRPDYWWNLPNTFAILLNFTEVALLTIGLTYVIACGDIDLSVGAILALAGSTAAYCVKVLGMDPMAAVAMGMLAGTSAGVVNGLLTVGFGLPAFIATLGMYYIARGLAAWIVAGQQLTGFPEKFNLFGRKIADILAYFDVQLPVGTLRAFAEAVSVQTLWTVLVAIIAGIVLGYMPAGQRVYATGGNLRAAAYAGINTGRVRFLSLAFAGICAAMAGIVNVAYFRSFNPVAGQFRELDAIASVIIGGGSIFGGYGTIIGALAGAAVITLIRALLQLNIITAGGGSFVMPQHWVNVFIGLVLIAAVLIDIWLRQSNILAGIRIRLPQRKPSPS